MGKKEEKTSKRANTKAFLCVIKGVTYLILAGEEDEERRGAKRGNGRVEKSKKEGEIKREKTQRAHTKGRRKEESMRGEERGGRGRQL